MSNYISRCVIELFGSLGARKMEPKDQDMDAANSQRTQWKDGRPLPLLNPRRNLAAAEYLQTRPKRKSQTWWAAIALFCSAVALRYGYEIDPESHPTLVQLKRVDEEPISMLVHDSKPRVGADDFASEKPGGSGGGSN